ncbi:MAG: hypothetical protein KDH16_02370 [Rhodocyclaceae bacterium]|nr:hypothetical protein [Rhodocyclaceae bacterium]MCP5308988.1 hypothetical protein [Zoogloeaceae bacterium]
MQECTNGRLAGSRSATADMAAYLEQGRRLRSAALWNLATHLKPSIGANDAADHETKYDGAADSPNLQDMEYFLAEGRHLRNHLSGSYLIDGVRAICGSLQALASPRRQASR